MHAEPSVLRRERNGPTEVREEDLPAYPAEAVESIERALQALPYEMLWLTYKDVRTYFGVSRATVARRLKEGLVPGVSIEAGRVLEDAPVRRFDRVQLRWLLLAVRFHRRAGPAFPSQ